MSWGAALARNHRKSDLDYHSKSTAISHICQHENKGNNEITVNNKAATGRVTRPTVRQQRSAFEYTHKQAQNKSKRCTHFLYARTNLLTTLHFTTLHYTTLD